jgi:hypothetical protein
MLPVPFDKIAEATIAMVRTATGRCDDDYEYINEFD